LQAKLNTADKQRNELMTKIQKAQQKNTTQGTTDSLDAFMGDISSNTQSESVQKLKMRLSELDKERARLSKMLEIAKPSLSGLTKKRPAAKPPTKQQPQQKKQETTKPEETKQPEPEQKPEPKSTEVTSKTKFSDTEASTQRVTESEAPRTLQADTAAKVPENAKLIRPDVEREEARRKLLEQQQEKAKVRDIV
jgi:hypothetical protein